MSRRKAMAVWMVIASLTIGAGLATATNRNGCWKYADAVINWYNAGTGSYLAIFEEEARIDADSWSASTDVNLVSSGSGSTDHLSGYNAFYGNTGWLVVNEISSYSGCTVRSGRFRFNQTYLDGGSYTLSQKKHMACNSIGTLLGLSRDNVNNGCMNGTIVAPFPSAHDRTMINGIY